MAAEKERGGGGPGASKHLSKGLLQFFFLFPDETRDEKWRESHHPRKEKKFFLGSFKAEAICRSYTTSTLPLLLVQDMAWRIWPGGGDLWSA